MTATEDTARLCQQFLHLVNRYGQLEKMTHTYDGEAVLHLSEVHTIGRYRRSKRAQYQSIG